MSLHRALSDNYLGTNVSEVNGSNKLVYNNSNNISDNFLDSDAMLGRALTAEEEAAAVLARRQANNITITKEDTVATQNYENTANMNNNDRKLADIPSKTMTKTKTKTTLLQNEETPKPLSSSSASQTVNNLNANMTNTDHNSNQHFLRDKLALKRFREEM